MRLVKIGDRIAWNAAKLTVSLTNPYDNLSELINILIFISKQKAAVRKTIKNKER